MKYDLISENENFTVANEYTPQPRSDSAYQTEAQLEETLIRQLREQNYEFLSINNENDLKKNLRRQIERLNDVQFTDAEWEKFFSEEIANPNLGVAEKARIIQEDYKRAFKLKGQSKNIYLLKKTPDQLHANHLQVIHQYATDGGTYANRYDVTLLVNGLPLVHIELKRRGVRLKEAFNQINRYRRDSFWADSGLYEYVQVFVISNGTHTKYYSNTTRQAHIDEVNKPQMQKGAPAAKSFEFTSYWADAQNTPIEDIEDFARTFLNKRTLLRVLTQYCVLTVDNVLMVMRPYQIAAMERIMQQIRKAELNRLWGKKEAGGYIWHTTGSGKTLTSFKTAQAATREACVDKVLFVVDRKDLDYQTMKEYDKFQEGAANGNASTEILRRQLLDEGLNRKIIITTIQKLSNLVQRRDADLTKLFAEKTFVLIFDECHRSQFGEMHAAITKRLKRYAIYGFTGTPILPENAGSTVNAALGTTEALFGQRLHCYTIKDAIRDRNVLPFKVDYMKTLAMRADVTDQAVEAIDTESALLAPQRVEKVVEYTLENFDRKTRRSDKAYAMKRLLNVEAVASGKDNKISEKKQTAYVRGFNAMFATASITAAKAYYDEFKRQMETWPKEKRLKMATIFSFAPNGDEENSDSIDGLVESDRDFLERAIGDYNATFGCNYDTSEKFQNYYKDVSWRMKNRDLDLLIVVNMFLTGFDAPTLNTLFVDKNLKYHGLLQAFSRTNRILNSVKQFGNIVCFRDLDQATRDAIALFGNQDASGVVLLKKFEDYYNGFIDAETGKRHVGYKPLVEEMQRTWPLGKPIESETEQKDFARTFGQVLKLQNILSVFDEYQGKEILSEGEQQDYQGLYLDIRDKLIDEQKKQEEDIVDDLVFEMELVKQVDINVDYILELVKQYQSEKDEQKEVVLGNIRRAVDSSPRLRPKKDLVEAFVQRLTPQSDVDEDWGVFLRENLVRETDELISTCELNGEKTRRFIERSFANGYVETVGTDIVELLPKMHPIRDRKKRAKLKEEVKEKLQRLFDRYQDLVGKFSY